VGDLQYGAFQCRSAGDEVEFGFALYVSGQQKADVTGLQTQYRTIIVDVFIRVL